MHKNILIALLVLFISALCWLIYQRLDWKEQTIDLGWMAEANHSPYLAAKLILERSGVEKVENLSVAPSTTQLQDPSAIFLPDASFLPLASQQEALIQWVNEGGTLLIGSGDEEFPPILKLFGFSTSFKMLAVYDSDNPEDESDEELSLSEQLRAGNERLNNELRNSSENKEELCVAPLQQCNELDTPEIDRQLLTSLSFDGIAGEIVLHIQVSQEIVHPGFSDKYELENDHLLDSDIFNESDVFYWAGDKNGVRFVQLTYGKGIISVISDAKIFNNANLAHFDHAYLLNLLFAYQDYVMILEGKQMAPLSTLLWRHYREALLGLLCILFLAIWHLSRRFGAIRDPDRTTRRSREEGMRAIGQWYWRRGQVPDLLKPMRQDILNLAQRHWPTFKRWPVDKQHKCLAAHCQIEVRLVAMALEQSECKEEQAFLQMVKNLQNIRKCL